MEKLLLCLCMYIIYFYNIIIFHFMVRIAPKFYVAVIKNHLIFFCWRVVVVGGNKSMPKNNMIDLYLKQQSQRKNLNSMTLKIRRKSSETFRHCRHLGQSYKASSLYNFPMAFQLSIKINFSSLPMFLILF